MFEQAQLKWENRLPFFRTAGIALASMAIAAVMVGGEVFKKVTTHEQ